MIAPTPLGGLIAREWQTSDDALVGQLRALRLVREDVSDEDLHATFRRAREENAALSPEERLFNSPNERVRVFLDPFLSAKGKAWAVYGDKPSVVPRRDHWRLLTIVALLTLFMWLLSVLS